MTAANVATSWIIAPTILPAITAAVMILVWRRDIQMQRILSVASTFALLGIALFLYSAVSDGETDAYRLGAWPAPFGIVLAVEGLPVGEDIPTLREIQPEERCVPADLAILTPLLHHRRDTDDADIQRRTLFVEHPVVLDPIHLDVTTLQIEPLHHHFHITGGV